MKDYAEYDALGLAELVAKGDVTPGELLEAVDKLHRVHPNPY